MLHRHFRSFFLVNLVFLFGLTLVLGGCGSPAPTTPSSSEQSPGTAIKSPSDDDLNEVLHPLKLTHENYTAARSGGTVVNEDRYQESLLYSRKARDAWVDTRQSLEETSASDRLKKVDQAMESLVSLVERKRSSGEIRQAVENIRSRLSSLSTRNVPAQRRGTVNSVHRADRDIQAETQAHNIRVGAALLSPRPLYHGSDTISRARNRTHQLRVWLREVRTKRPLPGAQVTAQFLDADDNVLDELQLLETWGPYLFYGQNLTFPEETQRLRLQVEPSTVGRHGDMKDLLTKSFTLEYSILSDPDSVAVSGSAPEPVAEDYTIGSDVEMALDETLALNTTNGFRIGFIAEHSEPFWVYRSDAGAFNLADLPQNANRHLEIVLFTADSYRIVPHAEITVSLRDSDEDNHLTTPLPFLLSAFHHYGNSVYLPAGSYTISTTVGRPDIHTLKPGYFQRATTQFDWNAEPVQPGSEGDEDHHDE